MPGRSTPPRPPAGRPAPGPRLPPGPRTCGSSCGRDLVLRPAGVPVDQDLHDVDHFEGSPRHRHPPPDLRRRGATVLEREDHSKPDTHPVPTGNYVIEVGNYVTVSPSRLGNFVTVHSCGCTRPRPGSCTARTEGDVARTSTPRSRSWGTPSGPEAPGEPPGRCSWASSPRSALRRWGG
ncbi:hypothetical protein FRAHR75_570013 [Frankia sp. Hr75.2]|nr:hypothetical protein FRAHR75_570013 [Frankia sp. Hr75.2]